MTIERSDYSPVGEGANRTETSTTLILERSESLEIHQEPYYRKVKIHNPNGIKLESNKSIYVRRKQPRSL